MSTANSLRLPPTASPPTRSGRAIPARARAERRSASMAEKRLDSVGGNEPPGEIGAVG